jgi:N-methylhydantoinase A
MKIGIDVGGTFTDFLLLDGAGNSTVCKVLSTPDDPSRAVFAGLNELAAGREVDFASFLNDVEIIVHGTTVTTNAVLTGNIAATGLITTKGFRDALQMRRGEREVQYDNKYLAPEPLVPRWLRRPVSERVNAEGVVLQEIDVEELDDAIRHLEKAGVEAVAVCFMHSYRTDINERIAAARVKQRLPGRYLSVSSEILPQVRFYDRISTTVLNACVGPILDNYLQRLVARLEEAAYPGLLLIMQSNGGVATPAQSARLAAGTLLSGPAAAPVAGLAYSAVHDQPDFITIDMGGTSFDAALVKNGAPSLTTASRVNRHLLALESMEINTIGAGGGSIASLDDSGLLRMGPKSAGADPGPVCYGRGGQQPTCTDANLLLGYLSPEFFAGGEIQLDLAATSRAVEEKVAKPLGLTVLEAAHGMFQVSNVNMATAIREITVQKGYDPRDFPLVCAGGAGPIHAACIAEELEITRILIPRESSIFCAAGMLHSDLKHDFVRSYHTEFSSRALDAENFGTLLRDIRKEGEQVLALEQIGPARREFSYALDLRYAGQYHEVNVAVAEAVIDPPNFEAICTLFHAAHNRLYGYDLGEVATAVNLVNIRVSAKGLTDKPEIKTETRRSDSASAQLKGQRKVFLPGERVLGDADVYDGDALGYGHSLTGPAIVEQRNTTIFVPPGWRMECDALASFLLERD